MAPPNSVLTFIYSCKSTNTLSCIPFSLKPFNDSPTPKCTYPQVYSPSPPICRHTLIGHGEATFILFYVHTYKTCTDPQSTRLETNEHMDVELVEKRLCTAGREMIPARLVLAYVYVTKRQHKGLCWKNKNKKNTNRGWSSYKCQHKQSSEAPISIHLSANTNLRTEADKRTAGLRVSCTSSPATHPLGSSCCSHNAILSYMSHENRPFWPEWSSSVAVTRLQRQCFQL